MGSTTRSQQIKACTFCNRNATATKNRSQLATISVDNVTNRSPSNKMSPPTLSPPPPPPLIRSAPPLSPRTLVHSAPSPSPLNLEGVSPESIAEPGNFGGYHVNQGAKIGIVIGTTMALVVIISIIFSLKRKLLRGNYMMGFRKKDKKNANIKAFLRSHDLLIPRQYSYGEIKKMTNSFTDKLGQGGFGGVFKGKLPDGRLVAVKVLNDSKSNGEDFINEVSSISRTSHVNIVYLLGFCYKPKRVLIYEYMSNGSLDKFIYNQGSSSTSFQLEWKMLYEIAVGIARGLEYLHRGCNTRILHFDIKPHNILLDENFCAKISDFGLAKLSKRDQSTVSMIGARGTRGYIAPEVCSNHFGRVTFKSDVYSYGMMVLEMVGKRKNLDPNVSQASRIYFPHYIYKHIEANNDLHFDGVKNKEEEEIAKKMILVSLWCVQTNPSDRPSMSVVIEMLQGSLQSLLLPPNPFLSSPTTSPQHSEHLE